jgi:hypothetical protein
MSAAPVLRRGWPTAAYAVAAIAYVAVATPVLLGSMRLADATKADRAGYLARARDPGRPTPPPRRPDIESLTAATRLAPTDAEAWYAIGKAFHRLLVEQAFDGPETALVAFDRADQGYRRAARLNAAFADAYLWRALLHRWAAFGGLGGLSPDGEAAHARIAEESFRAAATLALGDATVRYEQGVFHWRSGRRDDAVADFAGSLALATSHLADVVAFVLDHDANAGALAAIVPDDVPARLALARALLDRDFAAEAFAEWKHARELAGVAVADDGPGIGVVANGGFERPFGESFHDWEIAPVVGVTAERDPVGVREAAYALALRFDRAAANYFQTRQVVPVVPLARYRIQMSSRAEDVGAGERVGVEVVLEKRGRPPVVLCEAAVPASRDWADAACTFQVPFGAWKAVLRARRFAPEGATGSGTVWIDAVRLTEDRAEALP